MRALWCLLIGAMAWGGCATGPAVRTSKDLPLERVVLYRNGVGYFERQGSFKGDELEFQVRKGDVGDFLSSLTAVSAEGEVKSVSFEVEPADDNKGKSPRPPPGPIPLRGGQAYVIMPPEPPGDEDEVDEDRKRVDVRLRLGGKHHRMTVSYVVAAPIWKPTYRVVFDGDNALLQAWAVVQNLSGEDWKDVKLSLTTGAPIAFRSDLENPVTPPRPLVTDSGEMVHSVPGSETSLAQRRRGEGGESPASNGADARGGAPADMDDAEMAEEMAKGGARSRAAPSRRAKMESAMPAPAPEAPRITADELQRSLTSAASAAILSDGLTRYDFDGRVTIPDGGSTMVAILSKRVPGESAHLYAPDGGVPGSHVHPFRVARFTNATGAALERGPIAFLGDGDFLGQGVLDPLPRDATTFVPFAVDRSIALEPQQRHESRPGKLIRVADGQVVVEVINARLTTYEVRNGNDRPAKLYIRHPRMRGAELHEPPDGVELSPGRALVPMAVPAHDEAKLVVEERTPARRTVSFMSSEAAAAVKLYLEGSAVDAAQGPALRRALELRSRLSDIQGSLRQLEVERKDIERTLRETRANLESIKKVEGAADLRQRLVRRISDMDRRSDAITREMVEKRTEESELKVRLDEAVREITLVAEKG
jgi:hypothetical protein